MRAVDQWITIEEMVGEEVEEEEEILIGLKGEEAEGVEETSIGGKKVMSVKNLQTMIGITKELKTIGHMITIEIMDKENSVMIGNLETIRTWVMGKEDQMLVSNANKPVTKLFSAQIKTKKSKNNAINPHQRCHRKNSMIID